MQTVPSTGKHATFAGGGGGGGKKRAYDRFCSEAVWLSLALIKQSRLHFRFPNVAVFSRSNFFVWIFYLLLLLLSSGGTTNYGTTRSCSDSHRTSADQCRTINQSA